MLVQAYPAPQNPRNLGGQISYTENVSDGNFGAAFQDEEGSRRNVAPAVNREWEGLPRNQPAEVTKSKRDDSDFEFKVTKQSENDVNLCVESDLTETMSEVLEWEITVAETFTPHPGTPWDNASSGTGKPVHTGVAEVSARSLVENGSTANKEIGSSHLDVLNHENTTEDLQDSGFQENLSLHMIQGNHRLDHDTEESCLAEEKPSPRAGQSEKGTPRASQPHRVTFKTENEVAEQHTDGSFSVSYSNMQETEAAKRQPTKKHPSIKVHFEEKSSLLQPMKIYTDTIEVPISTSEDQFSRPKSFREEEEWDNPFQPEGEVSHDADLILQLWKGGVEVSKETLHEVKLEEEESQKNNVMEEKEGSDNETKPNIVDNPSCPNSAAEDDGQEEEDKNIKENLERSYQSMKSCTLDSCGSDEQSSICYPMAVVEKKKHKDIFKKHCKMM